MPSDSDSDSLEDETSLLLGDAPKGLRYTNHTFASIFLLVSLKVFFINRNYVSIDILQIGYRALVSCFPVHPFYFIEASQ